MGRFLKIALPVFVVGFISGAAFWYLASPLWIDREVNEQLAGAESLTVLATGTFRDADRAHKGSGTATLLQQADGSAVIRFTDFQVTNGPDLEVWLSSVPDPQSSREVLDGEWVSLGQLKGNIGDQNYTIPADVDLSQFQSVVIWCEQFSVLFSPATLTSG